MNITSNQNNKTQYAKKMKYIVTSIEHKNQILNHFRK